MPTRSVLRSPALPDSTTTFCSGVFVASSAEASRYTLTSVRLAAGARGVPRQVRPPARDITDKSSGNCGDMNVSVRRDAVLFETRRSCAVGSTVRPTCFAAGTSVGASPINRKRLAVDADQAADRLRLAGPVAGRGRRSTGRSPTRRKSTGRPRSAARPRGGTVLWAGRSAARAEPATSTAVVPATIDRMVMIDSLSAVCGWHGFSTRVCRTPNKHGLKTRATSRFTPDDTGRIATLCLPDTTNARVGACPPVPSKTSRLRQHAVVLRPGVPCRLHLMKPRRPRRRCGRRFSVSSTAT